MFFKVICYSSDMNIWVWSSTKNNVGEKADYHFIWGSQISEYKEYWNQLMKFYGTKAQWIY